MANVPGYVFETEDDTSADRHNTAIANAVIDLANNTSGLLDGTKIEPGTIDASQFADDWNDDGGTINAVANGRYAIGEGDVINLPAPPSNNDSVKVYQLSGDLSTTPATINGNGKNLDYNLVNGIAADGSLSLDKNFLGELEFTYNSGQDVWKLT